MIYLLYTLLFKGFIYKHLNYKNMGRIILKVIEEKIVEKDFSLITKEFKTTEEQIEEIKRMFEFEDDKTQMNEMIKKIKKQ